jgi:hypothetical protein
MALYTIHPRAFWPTHEETASTCDDVMLTRDHWRWTPVVAGFPCVACLVDSGCRVHGFKPATSGISRSWCLWPSLRGDAAAASASNAEGNKTFRATITQITISPETKRPVLLPLELRSALRRSLRPCGRPPMGGLKHVHLPPMLEQVGRHGRSSEQVMRAHVSVDEQIQVRRNEMPEPRFALLARRLSASAWGIASVLCVAYVAWYVNFS